MAHEMTHVAQIQAGAISTMTKILEDEAYAEAPYVATYFASLQ